MAHDLLAIYLTDHLAGAVAGSRRMHRLADAEHLAQDGPLLAEIAMEVDADKQTLSDVLRAAGVTPRWYKTSAAWLAERAGLLKTNGRLVRRSPLTSVLELEGMRMGVTGKLALWMSLQQTELGHRFDFCDLAQRARRQLSGLETAHGIRAGAVAQRSE